LVKGKPSGWGCVKENGAFKGGMMMRTTLCMLVLMLLFIPMKDPGPQAGDEFKTIEENGVTTAINPDHPIPVKDNPRDIFFTEELRIGSKEGDPNYIFGEFISYAVDDEGNVYVLDWREKTVKKYDRFGKFLLSFGGSGQGPGEFSSPSEMRYLPGGHLIVFEGENQKYTCFTKEGSLTRTGRFEKLMFPPYFCFASGNYIAMNVLRDQETTTHIIGIFDEKSELIKPLHQMQRRTDPPWPRGNDPDSRARRFAETFSRIAFKPSLVMALNESEQIYFANTDRFEIKIARSDGRLIRIIKADLPFLPLRAKDRRAFLDYRLPKDISTWNTMEKNLQEKIKRMIEFPETKPAFLSLIPMDDNYLLVVREGEYRQDALIDIFDPEGRFIIEKRLAFNIRNGICKGGRLYTIYEDDDGYQFIKCFSLRFHT
jgi:hypothetical protein